jgi:DNA-binding transcriptional ArsR family regulator
METNYPTIFDIQADFCKAMGNAGRLHILHVLRERPKTVGEICRETSLPQGNVSRHLACLRTVGVVIPERHGRETVYKIADVKIVEVCDLVHSVLTEQIQKRIRYIE